MVGKKLSGIKITSFTHMSVTWLEGRKPRKAYITYMHCKIKSALVLRTIVSYSGITFFIWRYIVVEFKWDVSNISLGRAGNCQAVVRLYSSHFFVCFQLVLSQYPSRILKSKETWLESLIDLWSLTTTWQAWGTHNPNILTCKSCEV